MAMEAQSMRHKRRLESYKDFVKEVVREVKWRDCSAKNAFRPSPPNIREGNKTDVPPSPDSGEGWCEFYQTKILDGVRVKHYANTPPPDAEGILRLYHECPGLIATPEVSKKEIYYTKNLGSAGFGKYIKWLGSVNPHWNNHYQFSWYRNLIALSLQFHNQS